MGVQSGLINLFSSSPVMGWGRSIRLFRAVREDGLRLRLDQDDVSEGLAVRGDRGEVGVQR